MRTALITQDFPPEVGGIETYSYELSLRFFELFEDFLVVAPAKSDVQQIDRKLDFSVQRIPVPNTWLGWGAITVLPPVIRRKNIDTLFHTQWQTLPVSWFMKRNGLIETVAVAAHARELLFNPFEGVDTLAASYEQYMRWLLSKGDLFFPVSRYTAGLLIERGVDAANIEVVGNGTNPDFFYPRDASDLRKKLGIENRRVVLTVSRLVGRKGIDTVLRALPRVIQQFPDLIYLVAGEGEEERPLKALAGEMGLENHVAFLGRIPYEQLPFYYSLCDLFVMPSKYTPPDVEGYGIVFLEANACGKPVIGADTGGIPDAIVDGETGFLVEPEQPEELAEKMTWLLENQELARRLGKNGMQRVKKTANWNAVAQKLFDKLI